MSQQSLIGCLLICIVNILSICQAQSSRVPDTYRDYPYVQVVDGYLSVKVQDYPLNNLLATIARQGNFIIRQPGKLEGEITVEFYALPLWQGLRRILRDRSFALQYAEAALDQQLHDSPRALWLFPLSRSSLRETAEDKENNLSVDFPLLQAALNGNELDDQEQAIAVLADSSLTAAIAPLRAVLLDGTENLREAALEALADIGGTESVHAIATALLDPQASIREEAVYALGEVGGEIARLYLQQALTDESEPVREAAEQVLEELAH